MNMNAWDSFPNAKHIDRVVTSVKENPKLWEYAWLAIGYQVPATSRDGAFDAISRTAITLSATPHAADAVWDIVASLPGVFAAHDAILALIAYDDSAKYLDMPPDQLKMLYALTEHPAALLLQPAVLAFSMERALA
jgi:hypothetical protein